MKKTSAFTLAETLITLVIIGVVAAMTLPGLTESYKRKENSVRLKKFYTTMEQAILLSQVKNGDAAYWDKESLDSDDKANNYNRLHKYFLKYIEPYLKYTSYDRNGYIQDIEDTAQQSHLRVKMSDGSLVYLFNGDCIDMILDLNGTKAPNKWGFDRFDFLLCNNGECGKSKFICSYLRKNVSTREEALEKCKTTPQSCTTLLQFDNWELKKDYPYKL